MRRAREGAGEQAPIEAKDAPVRESGWPEIPDYTKDHEDVNEANQALAVGKTDARVYRYTGASSAKDKFLIVWLAQETYGISLDYPDNGGKPQVLGGRWILHGYKNTIHYFDLSSPPGEKGWPPQAGSLMPDDGWSVSGIVPRTDKKEGLIYAVVKGGDDVKLWP